jgi:hypothetical protein
MGVNFLGSYVGVWGSHSSDDVEVDLMGFNTVWTCG